MPGRPTGSATVVADRSATGGIPVPLGRRGERATGLDLPQRSRPPRKGAGLAHGNLEVVTNVNASRCCTKSPSCRPTPPPSRMVTVVAVSGTVSRRPTCRAASSSGSDAPTPSSVVDMADLDHRHVEHLRGHRLQHGASEASSAPTMTWWPVITRPDRSAQFHRTNPTKRYRRRRRASVLARTWTAR